MKRLVAYSFCVLFIAVFAYPVGYYVTSKPQRIESLRKETKYAGVGAYVINLDRSKDRLEYVMPRIQALELPIERVVGVDGSLLSPEEIQQKVDMESYKSHLNHYPKKGTIGCSLSHIKSWKAFLDSDYEFALIFEDDVQFDPAQLKNVVNQLVENKGLWDINSFELSHLGTPLTIKKLEGGQNLSIYLTEITHAGCYMINRKAAECLVEKALPINMPIDHYFARPWEFGLRFTGVENPRIVHQNFGTSVIAASADSSEMDGFFINSIHMGLYKIQSYVVRIVYTLKMYING